mmetsp:Transcript_87914/g.251938  ORF Transcript_87914/g.251938 Transcript_87914/m.251938 type:complete len:257 (+) Transcript_87914:903-1673(+)
MLWKAARTKAQSLQQIASLGKLADDVVPVLVRELVLHLHNVLQATHGLRKLDLAERRLAELVVLLLQALEAPHEVQVQGLHREAAVGGHARGFEDVAEDGLLQVPADQVDLEATLDVAALAQDLLRLHVLRHALRVLPRGPPARCWRHACVVLLRVEVVQRHLQPSDHDRADKVVDHGPGKLHLCRECLPQAIPQHAHEALPQYVQMRIAQAVGEVAAAQFLEPGYQAGHILQACYAQPDGIHDLAADGPQRGGLK